MNAFSRLHFDLVKIQDQDRRINLLDGYFRSLADIRDLYWATLLLGNNERRRFITFEELRKYASSYTNVPMWLIDECIRHTGYVTDAIALIVQPKAHTENIPLHRIMEVIHSEYEQSYEDKVRYIFTVWHTHTLPSLRIFNRLITGSYRSPVTGNELMKSLSRDRKDPAPQHAIKTVLLYASPNEYTFAVRKDELLIPVVKTSNGLRSEDRLRIREFVLRNTRERFGPVHSVPPELIFEIGFETVERAPRRKSGVRLISPRIMRHCTGLRLEDVDQLDTVYQKLQDDIVQ